MTNSEFRFICKHYHAQRAMFDEMNQALHAPILQENIEKNPEVLARRKTAEVELGLLADNLYCCSKLFDHIEDICGPTARNAMWRIYVDRQPYQDIAKDLNIPLRKLEMRLKGWKDQVGIS